MDPYLQITDNELVIPGLKRKRVFFHISDTHLAVRDALSTEEEARQAEEWEARWMVGKENFARSFGEHFSDAQRITTVEGFDKMLAFARDERPDALLFTGDNLECMHPAGERFLAARMKDCPLPFLAVPGNHESASLPGVWEPGVRILDYGDFRVVGVDDRLGTVSGEDLDRLAALGNEGIPMIVTCHIPVSTAMNRERMSKFSPYFFISDETADENGIRFVRFLMDCTAVKLVLCGHIHGYSDAEIAPGKRQITASQGMIGFIHRLTVRGENG